jgi:hypothetical protein
MALGDLRSMRGRERKSLYGSGPRSVFNILRKKREQGPAVFG